MDEFSEHKYDQYFQYISKLIASGKSWEQIEYADAHDEEGLIARLHDLTDMCVFDREISPELWHQLVKKKREIENRRIAICDRDQSAILSCGECAPEYKAAMEEDYFAIFQYKKLLEKRDFKKYVIENMDEACRKTMRFMSQDTTKSGPVKGLLIGDVQSGKTANMAGLIALTADYNWNFYIILSGTIENLRKQTQERLVNDLTESKKTRMNWIPFDYLEPKAVHKLSTLDLNEDSGQKHINVCLKQSKRIEDLIKWFNQCPDNAAKIKLVIIDDEADQASINTANLDDDERSKIFGLISDLVNNKGKCKVKFKAVNYISYTATPYANILNDASSDSLYPESFIYTLPSSFSYFGPKMIFGSQRDETIKGMSIIENIPMEDVTRIETVHKSPKSELPKSMKEALAWFLCGVSALRLRKFQKPLTMLIHTSQLQRNQSSMAKAVELWLTNTEKKKLLEFCRQVYAKETVKFNKATLTCEYPNYDYLQDVQDFPDFDEFSDILSALIDESIQHIEIDQEGELKYSNGIHLCVDNCRNNKSFNNKYLRILYPSDSDKSITAPAFIVIGGNTLSRGLTLKGLFTSYFLRVVKQADTLMQMGRWFGYRKNYEIYQRIWMTDDTKEKFQFLSDLNEDLKSEIEDLSKSGMKPLDYKTKIRNSPKLSWLRITSKNKMQNAIPAAWDFAGSIPETNYFLKENIAKNTAVVTRFISQLGSGAIRSNIPGSSNYFWENIKFETLQTELLEKYSFPSVSRQFNEIGTFIAWLKETSEKFNNWTVIAAGTSIDDKKDAWTLPNGKQIGKIYRTIQETGRNKEYAHIRTLNSKIDYLSDVNLDTVTDQKIIDAIKSKRISKSYKDIRSSLNRYAETPLLIIYCVDHTTSLDKETGEQISDVDLMGLSFFIPGRMAKDRNTVVSHLTVCSSNSEDLDINESGEE